MSEYVIDEELARRAQESWSWSDYKKGSTTEYYNSKVAEIEKLAEDQKKKTDPMYHDHIDGLVEKYKRKLAENINARNANTARVPSVMIAGPANFPVRKKEKQNARENALWEEFNKIENIANQIKSAGTAGISADSDNAINKIAKKISEIEQSTAQMKAINAYYKKNKTLDGIEKDSNYNSDLLEAAKWSVGKYPGDAPFSSYNFSGNSAEIRRLRDRLVSLNKSATEGTSGDYTFNGGTIKNNTELNRLQIFFDERPDSEMVSKLKKNGFHWSPSNKAWQRQTTDNAKRAIENYLGLDGLTSTGEKTTKAYAISEEAQKVIDSANTKKAEAAARKQAKEERSKEFNDFLNQHGFYALSKEQLDEGRAKLGVKEGEKVISIGYGYFIDPKYKDEYIERFVKKKPSSKKAAPASAETAKVPNDVLTEKPAPVEKTEPNNKPAGGSFVSEKYVVDEHYIDNLHAEKAKPAEQAAPAEKPKSTATDAEKAISNMNPRLRERYERAFAKAKEKGYEIVQDKWGMPYFVTEKIEDEWSAADKTAAQKHLDKNGYILMTEYMTPSALDWVEEAGIKYTPKTPKSAPVEIKKSRVSQSAASEMPVAEVKAAEPPKPKEPKKYARKDIKDSSLIRFNQKLMAFYLPSKQFGRLYGITDNFGYITLDTPDGKEKKINYVHDPEWDAHVFYDNDNGRQLLVDVSNDEQKAIDNFLNLWPDIVEDIKENERERIKRLQDPKYVAAEMDDIELEERIRKHNVDGVSFQDIPLKRLKVTQDFDGNVFAQTDAVLRTFGKGRKDDPYFDIKLAGKDDFIKGHGTKSYLLGIQASGFKDIKKDIRFDFKNAKPVDKLEKKEPRQRYTLLKFDHKNYSLKPREEVTDEERRDSKTGLKNSGFTDAVEIVEEYNGVPIFQAFSVRNENLGKNGKLPEFFAKTKNDDNFIIAKSIKDVKGLIDNHVKRYGKESLVSMPSATNKANADEKKYKAIENMVGGLVGALTSKEFKEIKDEAFKNAKVASVTPPVDHSKEPVLADNDKESKRYMVIDGIEFERGEFYIADMDNPLKTGIKPVKGVMATIKDAKGDDVPVGLYHDAAKGRMKFVDLRTGIDIVSSMLGADAVRTGKEVIKGMSSKPYEGRIEKELARINADKPLNNYYHPLKKASDPVKSAETMGETPKEVVKEMMQKADVKDLGDGVKAYSLPVLADNVKQWYKKNYPTDELGDEINKDITFRNVLASVEGRGDKDVYDLLDVGDSVVRERVFEGLAERSGLDYGQIYDKWLESGKVYEEKARRPKSMSSDTDDYWKDFWNEFSMDGYELFRKSDHKFVTKANNENDLLHKLRAIELAAKASDTKPDFDYIRQVDKIYELGLSSIAYGRSFKEDNRALVDNEVYAIDDKSKKAIVDYVNSDIVDARVFAGTDSEGNNYVSLRLKPFDDMRQHSPGFYDEVKGSDGRTYRVTDKIDPGWDKKWKNEANEWLSKYGYIILDNLDRPSPIDDTFAPRLDYGKKTAEDKSAKAEHKTKSTKPSTLDVLGTQLNKGRYYVYDKSTPDKVNIEKGYIGTLKDSKGEDFMVGVTVGGGPKKGYWYQMYDLLSGALLGYGNTLDETTRLIAKPDFDYHKATERIGHGPLSAFQFIADAYKKKPVNKLYKEDWAKLVGDKGLMTYADRGYASREEELAAYVPLKHKDFDKVRDNPFEPRPGYYEYRNDDGTLYRQYGDYVTVNLPSRWAGDNNRTYVLFLTTEGAKDVIIDPATGRKVFTTNTGLGHDEVWKQFLDQRFEFFDDRLQLYESLAEVDETDAWTWKNLPKKEKKMRADYLADLEKVRKGKEKLPAKTFSDDGPMSSEQKKDLLKKAELAASSSDGHWALAKMSDRQIMELYKTTIPSAEFPEKQSYDAQLRFVMNSLPYKDKLMLLAKKEWAKEYTPLGELPKKSSAAKLTEPKKTMISWKQGAVRYGHGDDKKMKALWVVVTKEDGKWQAKFTTESPEGRKEEAGRPYTVKDSIKISGDIPADVQVQLGMFNVSFSDGKPVFKKIKGYVPKKKREKTEKSKIKLPTQKQLSKRI